MPKKTDLPVHPTTGQTALDVVDGEPVWPKDPEAGAPDPEDDPEGTDPEGGEGDDPDGNDDPEGDRPLGPAGEKALRAEKERRREEAKRRRAAEEKLAELESGGKKDDPDQIRRQAEQAATAKANTRLLRAEVRAVAAGKLTDPKDALLHMDLDQFEVDENGDVDTEEIADAITDLINRKPYLAAQGGKRFQGTGDGGAARKASRPKQLTKSDLKTMSPEAIDKARTEGRLEDLMGGK